MPGFFGFHGSSVAVRDGFAVSMPDGAKTVEESLMSENTGVTSTTEESSTPGVETDGFQPITSQDALNAIVEKRLSRERAKYSDYDELKAKAAKFDEFEEAQKSEAERQAEYLARIERENDELKRSIQRAEWLRDAAKETGLPVDALEVIQGDSYEEILDGAQRIKSLIPTDAPVQRIPVDAERNALPLNGNGIEDALRKALGMS